MNSKNNIANPATDNHAADILRLTNLVAVSDNHLLFHDVNATVTAGQSLWVRGENGCGKSTLLAMIAGILQPFQGEVSAPPHHYIAHHNGLHPDETIGDTIALWCKLYDYHDMAGLAEPLEALELPAMRDCKNQQLSAGQARKLNLLRLKLAMRPLWVLDEADNALDQQARALLLRWLKEHLAQGGMVVFTNHQHSFSNNDAAQSFTPDMTLDLTGMMPS